jgi:hypothetical protein
MATTNERVAVLETKVDELKEDITDMRRENRQDHATVIKKLERLESVKNYWFGALALVGPIVAYIAAHVDWKEILK